MSEAWTRLLKLVPEDMLGQSGKVFYTGREGFDGSAPIYLLGMNPGGSPDTQNDETLEQNIRLVRGLERPWSAYLDEDWHGKAPVMRASVPHLANSLGLDLRRVPASNVIFLRSETVARLCTRPGSIADSCWPFHAAAIALLQPKVIVCMGFSDTGKQVRDRLGGMRPIRLVHATVDQVRAYRNGDGLVVAEVRHPSRYWYWTNPAYDPTAGLRELLAL